MTGRGAEESLPLRKRDATALMVLIPGETGMEERGHEPLEERLLHRMLFFSDAVFAIVMTLLVLELRPPQAEAVAQNAEALWEMASHLGAFAFSFAVISIFWLAHMNATRQLARFDWATAVVNLVCLFPVCLLPFLSAWLGDGFNDPFSWGLYSGLLVATSAANIALVLVTTRDGGRLMISPVDRRDRAFRIVRAASPGLAFLLSLLVLASGHLHVAQFCPVLIPGILWLAGRLLGKKAAGAQVPTDAAAG